MAEIADEFIVNAWVSVARAYTHLLDQVEKDLAARKLPELSWYDVLLELRRESPRQLRPMDLQGRLLLAQHNLSRLLDRMEKVKLVKRMPHPDDGRSQLVGITAEGIEVMRRMWPVYRNTLRRALGEKLSARELELLTSTLHKIGRV